MMSLVRPLEISSSVNAIAPVTRLHASISLDVNILYPNGLTLRQTSRYLAESEGEAIVLEDYYKMWEDASIESAIRAKIG